MTGKKKKGSSSGGRTKLDRISDAAPAKVPEPEEMSEEDRRVEEAAAMVEKEFGKGAIMDMGTSSARVMAEARAFMIGAGSGSRYAAARLIVSA